MHSGESARSSHLSFRGAQPRGNLLEKSRKPYEVPGDCHVGLCPPRNDVVILTWSFYWQCGSGHPGRGGPTAFSRKRQTIHRVLKLCGQIPGKSPFKPLRQRNFPAKPQKTPQTFQSLWSFFMFTYSSAGRGSRSAGPPRRRGQGVQEARLLRLPLPSSCPAR